MERLSGKVALVTGCAGERGLGRAIAARLAAEGADLAITDIAPAGTTIVPSKPPTGWGGLQAVADEIRGLGRRALPCLLDIRSAAQVDAVIRQVVAELGRLDILVNNAAAPPGADRVPVVELTEAAWTAVLSTNLTGAFLVSRAAVRTMLDAGTRGRVISIGSDQSKVGRAQLAAYSTTKFGLIGFSQSLALEVARAGITVNVVCPCGVDSERLDYLGRQADGSYDETLRRAQIRERSAAHPMGRLARSADVAEVVAFLASDGAEYITGQAINVTGGSLMH